ncbi:MAG: winged helix-turn-helix domain-containing protein, partial [Polyangiaceae bacterium]
MTFIEAAAEVLRKAGKPLHYKEITELAIADNLLSHVGKTPEVTMSHRLTAAIKKDDKEVPVTKVRPGVFGLREWEEKKGKRGASAAAESTAGSDAGADGEGIDVNALEIEAALRGAEANKRAMSSAIDRDDEEGDTPVSGEEALRADLAASGAELFDDEDDDDQPILAPLAQPGSAPQTEGGRRRRRRRRRGRGGAGQNDAGGAGATPGERSS